ncbi:cbb3-type cytochrome oxidase assembly protein CcoS [Novosphingobium colocasiae]
MSILGFLIPLALLMGLFRPRVLFFWAMKGGQFDDLDGAANRILIDDEDDGPAKAEPARDTR